MDCLFLLARKELATKHAKIGFKEIQLFWFFHEEKEMHIAGRSLYGIQIK
jgi:hypothetical protein